MRTYAQAPGQGGGKRISQNDFTEKAWEAIISAPEIARNYSQQIVETEHLFKALLEQPNGLARRIMSKAGANPTQVRRPLPAPWSAWLSVPCGRAWPAQVFFVKARVFPS
jgi:hypothetical protein